MTHVTRILSAIEQGDPSAAEKLLPPVYEDLRKLAAVGMAREKAGQTLQAAEILGISPRTADHYWAYAKAWLREEIDGQ